MKDAVCKAAYLYLLSDRAGFASVPPRWAPSLLAKGVMNGILPHRLIDIIILISERGIRKSDHW